MQQISVAKAHLQALASQVKVLQRESYFVGLERKRKLGVVQQLREGMEEARRKGALKKAIEAKIRKDGLVAALQCFNGSLNPADLADLTNSTKDSSPKKTKRRKSRKIAGEPCPVLEKEETEETNCESGTPAAHHNNSNWAQRLNDVVEGREPDEANEDFGSGEEGDEEKKEEEEEERINDHVRGDTGNAAKDEEEEEEWEKREDDDRAAGAGEDTDTQWSLHDHVLLENQRSASDSVKLADHSSERILGLDVGHCDSGGIPPWDLKSLLQENETVRLVQDTSHCRHADLGVGHDSSQLEESFDSLVSSSSAPLRYGHVAELSTEHGTAEGDSLASMTLAVRRDGSVSNTSQPMSLQWGSFAGGRSDLYVSDSDTEDDRSHSLHSPLRVTAALSDFAGSVSVAAMDTIRELPATNVDAGNDLLNESDASFVDEIGDEGECGAETSGQHLPVGAAFAVARSRKLNNFLPL